MSSVQLALNVSDLDEAIAFYSKLFGRRRPRCSPGYANFAIADPPLKLVLIEDAGTRDAGVVGALNHLGVEVATTDEVGDATRRLQVEGSRPGATGDDLLLRRPGQGLGRGPRRTAVGDLHRAGGCPGRERVATATGLLRRRRKSPWRLPTSCC